MKVNLSGSSSAVVNQTFVGVILAFMWKEDKSVFCELPFCPVFPSMVWFYKAVTMAILIFLGHIIYNNFEVWLRPFSFVKIKS